MVIAMESGQSNINNIEMVEEGNLVSLKVPVVDRCAARNKCIFSGVHQHNGL